MPLPSENWHEVLCFLARADLDLASVVDHRSSRLVARHFSVYPLRALEHVIVRDSTTPGARPGDVDCEVRARNTGFSRFVASVEELVEALRDSYVFHYVDITGRRSASDAVRLLGGRETLFGFTNRRIAVFMVSRHSCVFPLLVPVIASSA